MEDLKPTITERRRITRNSMYRYIYEAGSPVSKQHLATAMEYSLPTVHQNLAELIEANLIRPGEMQKSTGGRPAVGYTVNETIRYAVGAAITANHLSLLLTDISQNELAYLSMDIPQVDGTYIGARITEELCRLLDEKGIDREKLLGVGITFPGVIDQSNDSIIFSPTLKMKNISLSALREQIPFPTFIENDSTSGVAAEWLGLTPEEKEKDFAYLFLENGVGGAIFIDGKPYLGTDGWSGEFGHMCIVPGGRECYCGKKGCLEAYISAFRFSRDLGITLDEFFKGLEEGNEAYSALWNEVLDYLSIGIANLRLAFDCNVILGGLVSSFMGPYIDDLRERCADRSPFESTADYIKLGKYPTRAGMKGVAWHFVKEFIDDI